MHCKLCIYNISNCIWLQHKKIKAAKRICCKLENTNYTNSLKKVKKKKLRQQILLQLKFKWHCTSKRMSIPVYKLLHWQWSDVNGKWIKFVFDSVRSFFLILSLSHAHTQMFRFFFSLWQYEIAIIESNFWWRKPLQINVWI